MYTNSPLALSMCLSKSLRALIILAHGSKQALRLEGSSRARIYVACGEFRARHLRLEA